MRFLSRSEGNSSKELITLQKRNPGPPGWRLCKQLMATPLKNAISSLKDECNHETERGHLLD